MSETGDQSGYRKVKGLSGNARGGLLMILSGVGFTIYLVLGQQLSEDLNPFFLAFWRAFIALLFSLPLLLRTGPSIMKTTRPVSVLVRSLFGTLGFTLALVAVSDWFTLSLAQYNAISFTRPLFVTLTAAFVLHEIVGPRRWVAVAIGFVGVLIMVMPGILTPWQPGAFAEVSFDAGSLIALISSFMLALAITLVKSLTKELSATALLLYANILSSLLLLPALFFVWSSPSLVDWGWIFLMAFTGWVSQYCYIAAMSAGEASFLSPLDYMRLPMGAAADWILKRIFPAWNLWLGAAIIAGSAIYIALRERRKGAERSTKPPL